jgi:hypothetical protein
MRTQNATEEEIVYFPDYKKVKSKIILFKLNKASIYIGLLALKIYILFIYISYL